MDLLLGVLLDVSLGKHGIKHGQVGGVGRQTGRVSNCSDMVVKIRDDIGVVT